MAQKIWVQAQEGERIPVEGKPREYITSKEPVEILETPYYTRLLGKEALVIASAPEAQAETKPQKKAGGK